METVDMNAPPPSAFCMALRTPSAASGRSSFLLMLIRDSTQVCGDVSYLRGRNGRLEGG
jgi:hypothetical protein